MPYLFVNSSSLLVYRSPWFSVRVTSLRCFVARYRMKDRAGAIDDLLFCASTCRLMPLSCAQAMLKHHCLQVMRRDLTLRVEPRPLATAGRAGLIAETLRANSGRRA